MQPTPRSFAAALLALLGAALLAACGAPDDAPPDTSTPSVFIALPRDFQGFTSWTRFDAEGPGSADAHTAGHRTLYVNRMPPDGSATFPVGTIIVKVLADGQTFAMAKRGGGFNARGAAGWEWFELQGDAHGTPVVLWRGIAPPAGEGYGATSGGSCNACHATAAANDSVQSPALRLHP